MTRSIISNKRIAHLLLGLFIFVAGCETHEDVTPSSQSSPSQVNTPSNTQPCLLTSLVAAYGKYNYQYTSDNRLSEIQHVLSYSTTPEEQWTMGYTNGQLTTISYYSGSVTPVLYTFEYGPNNKPSKLTQTEGTYLLGTTTYKYDTQDRLVMGEENVGGGVVFSFKYEYGPDNNVSKKYMASFSNMALAAVHHTYDNRERFFAASPDLTLVEIYLFNYDPSINNLIVSTVYFEATSYSQTTFNPYLDQTFAYTFDQNGYITSINEVSGSNDYGWLFTFYGATYSCK